MRRGDEGTRGERHGEGHRGGPWPRRGDGRGRGWQGRRPEHGSSEGRFPRSRGQGFAERLPENIQRAFEADRGAVMCNAWAIHLDESVHAWGYPLSIREAETERPVEERKERRKVIAELLKALTGIQAPPGQDRLKRTLTRGAQHSELLRWLIVYHERIRNLVQDEPTREVVVREGDVAAKVYSVTFGEERPLTGGAWRFYFVAAIMSILEAAKFSRALGQSHYLRMEPSTLRDADTLFGLDATLIQGEKTWLMKVSRHDRELEAGTLEDWLVHCDHQKAQNLYKNRVCVTIHRGGIYRITDVTDQTADTTHFERAGTTVTVAQYFREAHRQNVEGKQVVRAQLLRGGFRDCFLPVNLVRLIKQAPQPTAGGRTRRIPKSAHSTLKDYVEIMDQLLSNEAVKEQMSELKIQIGDNNLPVNVEAHTTSLQKLMGDVDSYGKPRLSWGLMSSAARGTDVGLGVDFQKELLKNLTLRHKVPLSAQWLLVICTTDRQREGARVEQDILDTIRRTRGRFRMTEEESAIDMDQPAVCEQFEAREAKWGKGQVEVTKRRFRELLTRFKGSLRGAIVVLAYDSEDTNNRVRVAAKQASFCSVQQVSVQVDFPIQCCKIETLRRFKKGEDKSFNVWWNVFIQFQTKIIQGKIAGIPWVADDLLAPIKEEISEREREKKELTSEEVVRAIGIAVNSFGNVEHTQFISHIGVSAAANFRAGVLRDMDKHFQPFWEKFCLYLKETAQQVQRGVTALFRVPPVHLIVYRSSPSGSAQVKEVLAQEIVSIRTFLEAELGKFSFSSDTHHLTLEHPMATAFPKGKFYLRMHACPAADMERCKHNAEALGTHIQPTQLNVTCDRARESSSGRFALTFEVETGKIPYYGRYALLTCTKMTNAETFKLESAQGKRYIVLPDSHPILKYARANSRWLVNITMQFSTDPKEIVSIVSPFAMIEGPCDTISPEVAFRECKWSPGTTVYLRKVFITQVVQHVHLNVMINPHRPASPLKFFMSRQNTVQGLAVGAYIDSGPIIPVSPDTGMLEEKFLIGTADPTRGSPSASEFQIIANDSDWSKNYLAVVSFRLCHLYYNWAGTVKHPHLLQMAIAIVRQHQIYIASGSGFGLDSEFDVEDQPPEQPVPEDSESPEEGEEPELQERRQKRRHEGGRITVTSEHSEISEQEAGRQNLEELKASLQNRESVLMTTAFML
ncbi:hypothetical protein Esti_004822 [Eimeria stiedai]